MYKRFDHRSSALHLQLNPAIIEIADATDEIKPAGGSCRKRAKSYPLHMTSHEDTRSNRRFINRLSHQVLPRSFSVNSHL